jgi:hypothetical protein
MQIGLDGVASQGLHMPAKSLFDPFAHFAEAGPRAIQVFQHTAKFIIV